MNHASRAALAPRESLERRLRLTMLLPLGLTALLAAALTGELLLLLSSAGAVSHTDQVIAQTFHIGTLVADGAITLDRYLLAGDAADLASYEEGKGTLTAAFAELGSLIADNPPQQMRLEKLIAAEAQWRESTAPLVARRKSGGGWEADALQQRRAQNMKELDRQLAGFVAVEEQLRDERAQRTHRLSRVLVVGTLAAALLLGGALGLFARRQLHAVADEYERALVVGREQAILLSEEERFRRLIEAVEDYAIFLLDPDGNVSSWNAGAERGTGWRADEILGQPFAVFFAPADRADGKPRRELDIAAQDGVARSEGQRVRKDGSQFLAEVTLTAVRDPAGGLLGFASIARDITQRRRSQAAIAELNTELERRVAELAAANGELEAFSYSVSHDLRGPLRAIDGFSKILLEDYRERLDHQGQHYLARVRAGSQRMGQLIDDLLSLARISRAEMSRSDVDLGQLARELVEELRRHEPMRVVDVVISDPAPARGDPRLLRAALANLLGNAWKFTSKTKAARIEFGWGQRDGRDAYFVRDNGAGFDMTYIHKLFAPFQRLHEQAEFEGTGIGLATVKRIITRHGGKLWAESTPGQGATFWFTLGGA